MKATFELDEWDTLASSVTVVLPTLGTRPDWLRLSLYAIRNQSARVNIVVVGPDIETIKILCEEVGANFLVETGRTLSAAINQGARENPVPTEFIGWIADDDVLAPGSLRRCTSALRDNTGAPFAFGRVRYIDAIGASMWLLRPGAWSIAYARYGRNFIPQPGSLQRLVVWNSIGGLDESLTNAMDLDLLLRMAEKGKPAYVPHELAAFRIHPGSISVVKNQLPSRSESRDVSRRHRRTGLIGSMIQLFIPATDRFLLSMHSRIPGPIAPQTEGRPYHQARDLSSGSPS